MNRGGVVISVLAIALVALLLYYSPKRQFGDQREWQVRYELERDALPYDRDFFIAFMQEGVEHKDFTRLGERFSKTNTDSAKGLYFFYDRSFNPDETETQAIMDFVRAGNDAFIIAENYSGTFFKNLRGISEQSALSTWGGNWDSVYQFQDTLQYSDMHLPIEIQVFGNRNALRDYFVLDLDHLERDFYGQAHIYDTDEDEAYLDEVEEAEPDVPMEKVQITGRATSVRSGDAVALSANYGAGTIHLHKWPILFTNSQFAKPEVYQYTTEFMKQLDYDQVYWDELKYQFLNNSNTGYGISERSYFEYILKNRPLKLAFFALIWGIVFFLLLAIKRRYVPIPILEPLKNSSKEFAKTIAQLYWLNPNHKRIAELKVQYFLRDVRERYQIRTDVLDESFKEQLTAKSGASKKVVNRLVDSINVMQPKERIHEDLLTQISDGIYRIKSTWR